MYDPEEKFQFKLEQENAQRKIRESLDEIKTKLGEDDPRCQFAEQVYEILELVGQKIEDSFDEFDETKQSEEIGNVISILEKMGGVFDRVEKNLKAI